MLAEQFRRFARLAGALVFCLGVVVLSGWTFGFESLKNILPHWPRMAVSTALCFVLTGTALFVLATVSQGSRWRRLARVCAGLAALMALFRFAFHVAGWDWGFGWLPQALALDAASHSPAQMAPATALAFLLASLALLLSDTVRVAVAAHTLPFLAALISWLGFSRYLYGGEPLLPYAHMAVHTSLGMLTLSIGTLCLRTDRGLMALLASSGPGGIVTRHLLPAAVIIPFAVGWLRLQAQHAGWFGTEVGLSLFALSNVIVFGTLIWASGVFLNRIEHKRQRAERATRESQRLLQAIIDNAAAVIWVKDLQGRYLLVNTSYEKLSGLSREQVAGKSDYDIFPKSQADRYRATDRAALDAHTPMQSEETAFDGEREITYLSVKSPLLDESGRAYALCGISTDITERKQADQALAAERTLLRTLIDGLPDVVFTKDAAGRFTLCNSAELRNVGFDRSEQLVGKTVFDLYPRELAELYHADDVRAFAGETVLNREEPTVDAAGQQRWYLTNKLPLRDAAGNVVGLVGMSRDITDRKRADENRTRAQKLEALGTLAGGIAHDFNNLLLAMVGNTKLAMADLPSEHTAQQSLREIKQAGARAIDLVARILTFTQGHEPNRVPIQLLPVAEEALNLLRPTLPPAIRISIVAAAALPAVAADATQIHQILVNLVTNAAYAIGTRVGVIELRLDPVEVTQDMLPMLSDLRTGHYVMLSVHDDGGGMDKHTLERIFDPFFTTKPQGEGTGLGLAMVHGIMQRHDGAITVYSDPGSGTTFKLYFPAVAGYAATLPSAPQKPARRATGHERVLYVDDEEALILLTKRTLERLGYRVTTCNDPLKGIELFRARPDDFDVVVTDLSMPGMNGFDLARALRSIRPSLPIVMTSGYVRTEDQELAAQLCVRALILKPNTVDELAEVLDRLFTDDANQPEPLDADATGSRSPAAVRPE